MTDIESCERLGMTPEQAATALSEMSALREQERANDAENYRLRKACVARAVELFERLKTARHELSFVHSERSLAGLDKFLQEIEVEAK